MKTSNIRYEKFKNISEEKYCSLCARYNLKTGYCNILKRKVKCPDEPHCNWFDRKENK